MPVLRPQSGLQLSPWQPEPRCPLVNLTLRDVFPDPSSSPLPQPHPPSCGHVGGFSSLSVYKQAELSTTQPFRSPNSLINWYVVSLYVPGWFKFTPVGFVPILAVSAYGRISSFGDHISQPLLDLSKAAHLKSPALSDII